MSNFYETYLALCENKGKAPTTAAKEAGLPKSCFSNWSKKYAEGKIVQPKGDNVEKLCAYFGVSRSELFGEQKEKPIGYSDRRGGIKLELHEVIDAIEDEEKLEKIMKMIGII